MANANVIFSIGSKMGPGGLASLKAGVDMVIALGKATLEAIKRADKYTEAFKRLSISVDAAESATKGLIDSTALMQNANRFAEAGLKITEDQYAAVSKMAVRFAKATGKDATDALKELTEALVSGETGALRRYGIQLDENRDKTITFEQGLSALEEQSKDTHIQLDTVSDVLFAISNNATSAEGNLNTIWGTMTRGTGVLDTINSVLDDINKGLKDVIENFDTMGQEFASIDTIASGMIKELDLAIWEQLAKLPAALGGDTFRAQLKAELNKAQHELEKFRLAEEEHKERTGGVGSLDLGQDAPTKERQNKLRKEKVKDPFDTVESSFLGTDELEQFSTVDEQVNRIELRREEIELMEKQRSVQEKMAELRKVGVDTSGVQMDFGLLPTEESNELKLIRLEYQEQETDLMLEQNEAKFEAYNQELELMAERQAAMDEWVDTNLLNFEVGRRGFQMLSRVTGEHVKNVLAGTEMEKQARKDMIADMAESEAVYFLMQSIAKAGEGIFALATGRPELAAGAFVSSAKFGIAAGGMKALSAGLGGGTQPDPVEPATTRDARSSGLLGTSGPSVGGGTAGDGQTNVTVVLQGDSDRLFEVVKEENDNRRLHSLSTIEGDR